MVINASKTMKMQQLKHTILLFVQVTLLLIFVNGCATKTRVINLTEGENVSAKLIYQNDFNDLLDWKVEQMPGGKADIINGKLEITDVSGCTIWNKNEFSGPIMIEYDVFIIKDGGPQDRVSDLNCFWMAIDPENPNNLFANSEKRGGKFSNYDSLKLYYTGMGGHDNTKTRFRRYVGNGEKPLLPEHDLSESQYLLQANTPYTIRIVSEGGTVQYYRDDLLVFDFMDTAPYTSGHFGFRTVNNHMTIDNFKVYQLNK